jgi:CRP-like cAMP-binding protein
MGDKINDLSFFKSVRPVVLKCLEDLFQFAIYKPGEIIVKEGDPGDAFYILSRGVVSVSVMQEGVDTPVVDLKEGQVFGEAALMESTPRTASCTAKELCLLLVLRKDHFQNLFNVCPEMKENLEDGLHLRTAQKLRKLNVPFFRSMGDKKLQVHFERRARGRGIGETWERRATARSCV